MIVADRQLPPTNEKAECANVTCNILIIGTNTVFQLVGLKTVNVSVGVKWDFGV